MCGVRKKRKVMVRRAPPARVFKGTTATAPGVDIVSLVRLVSDLTAKKAEQPIIPPAATIGIPEAAKNIKPVVNASVGTLQPSVSSVGTETIKQRATPYKSGFLSILPEAQKAKAIGERASERALSSKVFTEITKAGTTQITLPELEQRLQAGEILRPSGGRPTKEVALQRAAEAAGQGQPTLKEFGFTKP